MSLINIIKTSLISLKTRKLTTALTMIGIIIGISSVIIVLSIGNGLKHNILKTSGVSNCKKYTIYFEPENINQSELLDEIFTNEDVNIISDIDGVSKVDTSTDLLGSKNKYFNVSFLDKQMDIEVSPIDTKSIQLQSGILDSSDIKDNEIILTYDTSKKLFKNTKKSVGKILNLSGTNLKIIGVLNKNSVIDSNLISSRSYDNFNKTRASSVINFTLENDYKIDSIIGKINKELKILHSDLKGEFKLQDPSEIANAFSSILDSITAFVTFISGISLFVGGVGVMNIMYVTISERKREIGIRMAMGAKSIDILIQFLIESIIITLIAGIIGVIIGFLFSQFIGLIMPFKPILTIYHIIFATLTSILIGITFGIIPAKNATKLNPIEAIYK